MINPYDMKDNQIVLMELEQQSTFEHSHTYLEFVYIIGGESYHTLNGQTSKISAGDFFMLDCGTEHSYQHIGQKPLHLINCLFFPEFIAPALKGCRHFEPLMNNHLIHFNKSILKTSPVDNIFKDTDGSVYKMFRILMNEFTEKPYGYMERMRCKLIEILILMLRNLTDTTTLPEDDYITAEMICGIEKDCKNLSLQSFAQKFKCSSAYLSMHFKKKVGTTFSEYLQKVRVEKCCEYLLNTDMPLDEIAEKVGYSDLKFFHALFKKHMAQSPGAFRKHNRAVHITKP